MAKAQLTEEQVIKLNTYNEVGSRTFTHARIKKDARSGTWKSLIKNYPVIVTLGKTAEIAIKETISQFYKDSPELKIFHIPHPSGLNRKLNDPEWHEECVNVLIKAREAIGGTA